ncbi:HORMA domain-containing protein [Mycena indigotica]|uniref:HORMA domain-containing protein n=1 Tax=Mycena indigotica TaxID=2126181 RepID=A0A8H6S9R7_9AGAR|nr:HORMA domain-containing protein [Mycena indigotica]KAF7295596.1 HORMA domain-containing protein [Mycena indigotica]
MSRDLLPSDNFTDSHFTSSDDSFLSSQSSSDPNSSIDSRNGKNVNGFKIMEYGIFDALQKHYLRSFIFAIYLDEKDPTNIVEAYTFNFHYHTIPGTNTVIPLMSVGENKKRAGKDPVSVAVKNGKAPTLKDVKKSVKTLLKTLIHSTTQMDVLPKRRFAAFKLFYTDDTPADYEPPHFQAGDAQKDKWYFMTHDMDEVPDNWKMGQVETGHHSVNLSVASIATYLPSSTENEHATFTGTVSYPAGCPPPLTPIEEAAVRAEQAEKQMQDADKRNIVWAADAAVEGDDDLLDCPGDEEEGYLLRFDSEAGMMPYGVRNADGRIEPISKEMEVEMHFGGTSQAVPTRLEELDALGRLENTDMEQTQSFPDFPPAAQDRDINRNDSLPPSDILTSSTIADRNIETQIDIDTQRLQALALENQMLTDDTEMLDMETQMSVPEVVDPIRSFSDTEMGDQCIQEDPPTPKAKRPMHKDKQVEDRGLQCECDVMIDDELCFCHGCGRQYHVWCMGFHSTKDDRIPEDFICFDCRVHADNSWELIKVDLYPKMLSKFKDLALFRRAIKVAETRNPAVVAEFAKLLFKRLENEGFIVENTLEMDDLGFLETRSKATKAKSKSKGKQTKQRKNVQKAKYTFNRACLSTSEFKDYFDPTIESRLLDLPQKVCRFFRWRFTSYPVILQKADIKARPLTTIIDESQTQDDTQMPNAETLNTARPSILSKRAHTDSSDSAPRRKKVKISIAAAVDLAE